MVTSGKDGIIHLPIWLWSSTDCALFSSTKPNTIELRQEERREAF